MKRNMKSIAIKKKKLERKIIVWIIKEEHMLRIWFFKTGKNGKYKTFRDKISLWILKPCRFLISITVINVSSRKRDEKRQLKVKINPVKEVSTHAFDHSTFNLST